ncbi:MAG: hypothetical protein ACP5OA_05490 [Candidatus Woesearchaeota archaeon]
MNTTITLGNIMARKLTEQKVLEGLIESHMNNLEYMLNSGAKKTDFLIIAENVQIGVYITRYKTLDTSPKFWDYNAKLGKILDK